MAQQLSFQHLLSCLKEKDKYKGTQTYIQEALKFNQEIYPVINKALMSSLLDKSSKPMHRLMALRFFKELLITGNISLIDSFDQGIEEQILKVALYNKQNKEMNRGANYFIELQGQAKNDNNQRIGSSFVLLATQLLAVFSRWYNKDEQNQLTRFFYYVLDLQKEGITLPNQNQYNFFKKQQQERFIKNYAKWIKYITNIQQEQQIKKQTQNKAPIANNKIQEISINTLNINNNSLINRSSLNQQQPQPLSKNVVKKTQQNVQVQPQRLIQNSIIKSVNNSTVQHQSQLKMTNKQQNYSKSQNNSKLKQIQLQNKDRKITLLNKIPTIQQELSLKNEKIQKLSGQLQTLKQRLTTSQQLLNDKQNCIKLLQQQKNKLITSNVYEMKHDEINPNQVMEKVIQCYKITILPPRNIDDLIEQNQLLKEIVETTQQFMKKQKEQNKKQIEKLNRQKIELQHLLKMKQQQQKNNPITHLKQSNPSLLVINQIKLQHAHKMTEHQINFIKDRVMEESKRKDNMQQSMKNSNISGFVKLNQAQVTNQRISLQNRSKSLKKTQSSKNFYKKQPLNLSNFNMTRTQKFNNSMQNKLLKVSGGFSHYNQTNANKMATVFPFLQDYFPEIHNIINNFKELCLKKYYNIVPYYENDELKISLACSKNHKNEILIDIQNKTSIDKSIKLQCESNEKDVIANNIKRLRTKSRVEFIYKKDEVNFNFRFPVINITVKNHDNNQHTIKLPLPLTLLNYIEASPFLNSNNHKQTKEIKLTAFSKQPNFVQAKKLSPELSMRQNQQQLNLTGLLRLNRSQIGIEINQINTQIMSTIYCKQNDIESINFGKVTLQLIMFLLK